jgi:hypothetical protein
MLLFLFKSVSSVVLVEPNNHSVNKRQFYKPSRIGDMLNSEIESDEKPTVVLMKWNNSEKTQENQTVLNKIGSFFTNIFKQLKAHFERLVHKS